MKKVLVTGADGMLGSEVMRQLSADRQINAVAATIKTMDVTNLEQVRDFLQRERPTHVIHCAAYTQVDSAEKEALTAYKVNADGTKNLAFFCREQDVELIYLSTDYVFSGGKKSPYLETDRPDPINVYGMTKLLGETYCQVLLERHKVVRTSWLNGLGGDYTRNFIETMMRVSETRSTLSLVNDQIGRPTFTFDLARALVTLLDANSYGVFHVTNSGQCSWFELASEIFKLAGRNDITLRPILSEQFRSAARRPHYSVLANTRFEQIGLEPLPHWKDSLKEYFRRRSLYQSLREKRLAGPSPHSLPAR
ncbi:MAG: dTDP-4-dehydrorhamnose reductase [Candidatus Sumerlaeia bacterium]|nr:dTDP-4-dehydrorhamnose reductase [Candidatus Sumerlaeia bacterium]